MRERAFALMPLETRAARELRARIRVSSLPRLPLIVGEYLECHPEELDREAFRIAGPYAEPLRPKRHYLERLDYADGYRFWARVPDDPSWCL